MIKEVKVGGMEALFCWLSKAVRLSSVVFRLPVGGEGGPDLHPFALPLRLQMQKYSIQ